MRTFFADTSYFFALLNSGDILHTRALDVSGACHPFRTVTTEFVLIEVLRLLAKKGAVLRRRGSDLCNSLRELSDCDVIPASSELFRKAHLIYAQYEDKQWDLVDCASFVVMEEHGISEALTSDQHFRQRGFMALLRKD